MSRVTQQLLRNCTRRQYSTRVPVASSGFFLSRTTPKVSFVHSPDAAADCSRILACKKEALKNGDEELDAVLGKELRETLSSNFDASKVGATQTVYVPGSSKPHVLVSTGGEEKLDLKAARTMTFKAVAALQQTKETHASWSLDETFLSAFSSPPAEVVESIVTTAALTTYRFDRHKTKESEEEKDSPRRPSLMEKLDFVVSEEAAGLSERAEEASTLATATLLARDLANERPDVATPDFIEGLAKEIVEESQGKVTMESLTGVKTLEEKGLRLLSAVGQGARWDPRLLVLKYDGAESDKPTTALIGKGITFDSGGLNLKPTTFIEDMHMDMGGSAAVISAFRTAVKLNLKVNLVAAIALAENAIGPLAYKPHAIIESHSGLTVEIGNTDAEGRLVMADAMSYVQEKHKPSQMVDVATLTGACVVALGEYSAGLFSNDDGISNSLKKAGDATYERCWPMPILPEHTEELSSDFADTYSTGKGRYGGASTAAAFLQRFVRKDVKWAHLDIAGPGMYSAQREFMPKGGTGFGARLLVEFLKRSEQQQ